MLEAKKGLTIRAPAGEHMCDSPSPTLGPHTFDLNMKTQYSSVTALAIALEPELILRRVTLFCEVL